MRMLWLVLLASACETGGDNPLPDADPSLPLCTGLVYDACSTAADCMSMNCHLFDQEGIRVCTQACDDNTPCPPQNGQPASCNNRGICKPPAANACRP